ncbi:MAG: M50 family metallopeptidase [Solirubrobacteraceae bacterium]
MSFVLAFLGFAALIVLHELGHFAAAKAVGMRVERFSLFFPPLLARVRRGETEYAVGALPLGGYVKITGMNPHEELAPEIAHRAYYRQPVWKRIVVISAGPAVNIVLAFLILWALFWANGLTEITRTVDRVERGWPATGQLQPGDEIVSVDGRRGDQVVLSRQIASHTCEGTPTPRCAAETPAVLIVDRDGRRLQLTLTPVFDPAAGRTRLGYSVESRTTPIGPVTAAGESVSEMWFFTSRTVSTIAQLFKPEVREDLSGVVGAYEVTRQTIEFNVERAVLLLGIISLSLGVINLFPFLPLDGGHIFWAVAEKVRGRAIPFSVMERAGFVGFVLVIGLFMIGFTNDLDRLTGEGFGVR